MTKKKLVIIGSSIIIAALLVTAVVFVSPRLLKFSAVTPEFTFSQADAPGWWGGANYNSRENFKESEYLGETPREKLPVAGMTIMHGEGEGKSAPDNCFVMYSYYDYPLENTADAYQKFASMDGFATDTTYLELVKTSSLRISTPWGKVPYEFRQYSTVTDEDYLKGNAVGFAAFEDGHLEIRGVCQTAEQLADVVLVLPSVRLQ